MNFIHPNLTFSSRAKLLLVLWTGIFTGTLLLRSASAQAQALKEKPARILFLVDGSSSMLNEWVAGKGNRFVAASGIIGAIADSIHWMNPDVEFAIRVFGHQHNFEEKNCYDTKLEVGFGLENIEQIKTRLQYIYPRGYSPIAWSLKETAIEDFKESDKYAYSIILLTDGGESCGGDICATVTALLEKKISFRPYILSLVDYAPLKDQYNCLGKYLTVATEKDIVPAIKTIIDDNRKILTIRSGTVRSTPSVPPAVIKRTERPVVTIAGETSKPVTAPPPPEPEKPAVTIPVTPKRDTLKVTPVIAKKDTPATTPAERPRPLVRVLSPISGGYKKKMPLLFALSPANPVTIKRMPPFKNMIPAEVVTYVAEPNNNLPVKSDRPATPQKTTPPPPPPPSEVVEKDETAAESSLSVYFTNGMGKYYATEPEIVITDKKTGKQVLRTYRTVGAGGTPDAIPLPPGNYSLTVPNGSSNVPSFTITEGQAKRLDIKISNSTLAFEYPTNPKRPAKEYTALVSKRFESGPVVKQRGDERLPYEPANYHIEINTLPPTLRNVDLSLGVLTVVAIDEPGTVVISNTNNIGRVEFWYPLGDRYVRFYEMNVTGDPTFQKQDFKPGPYEARYIKAGTGKVEIVPFRVKERQTTLLNLEP